MGGMGKTMGQRRIHEGLRGMAAATLGFACLYAVAVVFFYCDWLFELPDPDPLGYGIALNGSLCAAALAMFAVSRRRSIKATPAAALGTAVYAIALALVGIASCNGSLPAAYGAGAAAGIGAGVLVPLWFDRAGLLSGDRFAYVLGAASLVSAPAALALDALPLAGLLGACGVLVVASSTLLVALDRAPSTDDRPADAGQPAIEHAPSAGYGATAKDPIRAAAALGERSPAEDRRSAMTLAVPLVYVALLSFVYGTLDFVAMASPSVSAATSGFASLVGGTASIAAFLLYVRFDGRRYAALLNVALALIATGLLFLPFLSGAYSVVLTVLTHMGWEIALLVSYALVIEVFRGKRRQLVGWSALVFAAPRPFVAAGSTAASLIAVDNRFAFAQMTVVAFALLYLILMGAWLLRTREKRAAERAIRKRDELIKRYLRARDDLQDLACDELAQEHGLTKRETELLKLLAQGRDAAYVEKTLFLSRNTVKSYTRSLYAKLGVHSKQEVIDLVKAGLPTA